jgi:hypothetical protein
MPGGLPIWSRKSNRGVVVSAANAFFLRESKGILTSRTADRLKLQAVLPAIT